MREKSSWISTSFTCMEGEKV